MNGSLRISCGSLLALLVLAAGAPASPIPVDWTEHWIPSPSQLHAQGASSSTDHYVGFSTTNPFITVETSSGRAYFVAAANLRSVSSSSASHPDHLNADYALSLLLVDETSNAFKVFSFHGHLSGDFWKQGSRLRNQFTDRSETLGLHLGPNTYSLVLDSFTPLRGGHNQYVIGGHLTAWHGYHQLPHPKPPHPTFSPVMRTREDIAFAGPAPLDRSPPSTQDAPEPSTLVLAGLGLSAAGSWTWWRLRRRAATC